jgi:hypothetical protein
MGEGVVGGFPIIVLGGQKGKVAKQKSNKKLGVEGRCFTQQKLMLMVLLSFLFVHSLWYCSGGRAPRLYKS